MKQQYLYLIFTLFLTSGLMAQTRYLDEVFTDVNVEYDIEYGQNISILAQEAVSLKLDLYTPAGDDNTERPLFLYFHTGSFLPQYINNQITGGRRDSTVVEICKRLARRGYAAAAVSYRSGWLPTAQDQDTRTGTLLQAAYRGVQDMKTSVRYFRRSVAEMDNPYGVDPTRIGLIGQGTGGYIAFGAYLDTISEAHIPKFIDSRTLDFYVIDSIHGNVQGTNTAQLSLPNHAGYTDDVQFVMEFGGAMGDISWLEGEPDREPPVVGFHVSTDPFAPFGDGAVIVPVTNQFVVNVSGPRTVVQKANDTGVNAVFESANEESNPLNDRVEALSSVPFDTATTFATKNFYPFAFTSVQSGPWEWWNPDQLSAEIAAFNEATGENISAVTLDFAGRLTNPDMSKEKAMRYIDTLMNFTLPRAYYGLDLANISSVDILDASKVALEMYPNPTTDYVVFRTAEEMPIKDIAIYNIEGRLMHVVMDVNNHAYEFQRKNLAPGMYVVKLRFEDGILSKKLVIRD
jgi:hypothetical protein